MGARYKCALIEARLSARVDARRDLRRTTGFDRRDYIFFRVFSRRRLLATAQAITLGVSASAQAQDVDPELQKQYDEAFQSIFADLGNLDKTFRFAELAVQTGNFEAAISALERMLLINPNLPRVRLELGVLYFRLGSYQVAKTYLDRAVEG